MITPWHYQILSLYHSPIVRKPGVHELMALVILHYEIHKAGVTKYWNIAQKVQPLHKIKHILCTMQDRGLGYELTGWHRDRFVWEDIHQITYIFPCKQHKRDDVACNQCREIFILIIILIILTLCLLSSYYILLNNTVWQNNIKGVFSTNKGP